MFLGYARVSTRDQDLRAQCEALTNAGCEIIHREKESGARRDRPALATAIETLGPGDVLMVTRIDRLARSTLDLLNLVNGLVERRHRLSLAWRPLARHDQPAIPLSSGRLRRPSRVGAGPDSHPHHRRARPRQGLGQEVRPQAEDDWVSARRSDSTANEWRSGSRDRQELRRRSRHNPPAWASFGAVVTARPRSVELGRPSGATRTMWTPAAS